MSETYRVLHIVGPGESERIVVVDPQTDESAEDWVGVGQELKSDSTLEGYLPASFPFSYSFRRED